MYVLRFMCDCIILTNDTFIRLYGTIDEPIIYILWCYAYIMTSYKYCALESTFLSMAYFYNLYFVYKKLVFTYMY